MAKILLVSLTTLKQEYLIDDNIDDKYLLSNIIKGQDFIVHPLLGDAKWLEITTQIDTDTVSEANATLIKDFIQPLLGYYVMSEVVYATAYKLKNAPEYQTNPNSDRFNELVRISKKYLIDSQHYEQILREYMCDNSIPRGIDDTFRCSIYLGPTKQCNNRG